MNLKKLLGNTSLSANIIANFSGTAINAVISLICIPIYLKYIGAEGYGLIGIFSSFQIILSLLDSGLSTTVNKELSRLSVLPSSEQKMHNVVKTLGNIYWIVAIFAGIIAIFISPFLAKYWVHSRDLSIQTITYAFIILSISTVFQFPSGFYSGGLLGLQKQVLLNFIRIIYSLLKNIGSIFVLLFISKSILIFFIWQLIVSFLQAFTMRRLLWESLPGINVKAKFDKQEIINLGRFASGILATSIVGVLITQMDKIILSKILTLDQFGYYTIACTMGLMIYQIVNPLSFSYFPKFSSLISLNDENNLIKLYHQASQFISLLVLPAAFILFFFSNQLIYIWTKNQVITQNTWLITSLYSIGTGINGLLTIPYVLVLSYGWARFTLYQNLMLLILMAPLTYILALKYGASGGALSWTIINIFYFLISPNFIHKKLLKKEKFKWYWHDNIKPFLVSMIVAGLFKLLSSLFVITNNYLQLFFIIIYGILTMLITLLFTNKQQLYYYLNYIKRKSE